MTPADICAQALDYISNIELIRTKSGRIQGSLSGELRKSALGLSELVRVLQMKAEAVGDPSFLKKKIEELLEEARQYKKDRDKEEERRKREHSELQEIIRELKKENQDIRRENREIKKENREMKEEMRSEMRKTRESLDRDSMKRESKTPEKRVSFEINKMDTEEAPKPQRKSIMKETDPFAQMSAGDMQAAPHSGEHSFGEGGNWPKDGESWTAVAAPKKRKVSDEVAWVKRPPILGKSTYIPVREGPAFGSSMIEGTSSRDIPMVFI